MPNREDQIYIEFVRFHRENPRVWELFERYALQASESGRSHYSAKAVFERIRWYTEIETRGEAFKLNNNYTAHYARMFHRAHPELDGFFKTRNLVSSRARVSPSCIRQSMGF